MPPLEPENEKHGKGQDQNDNGDYNEYFPEWHLIRRAAVVRAQVPTAATVTGTVIVRCACLAWT